jgi:flagellar hook-associated protein 2
MAGLSSPGIGSGLDINSLVTKLMETEQTPLKALAKKEADYQAKLTAYGTLKSSFASFQTAAKGLSSTSKFSTAKASAADATILAANASSIAKPGSYSVEVTKLAQSHKIASGTFADPATAIGTGTITIDFGTYNDGVDTLPGTSDDSFTVNADKTSKSITISSTNNSLSGIRDAINEASAGVTASILNDGDGYRLVLSSNDSGKANSLRVLVSGDSAGTNVDALGLSQLAYDPTKTAGTGKNLAEKIAAQNAELTIDGIAVSKSTNSISDAISGVTLNLLKKSEAATPTTVTVARDPANVKTAVEGFVKAYNDMAATMKDLGGYDFKTQKGGLLQGDATLRGLQSQARSILTQRLEYADGGVASLADIGISFQRDGTLSINNNQLVSVLADPTKNVAGLFAIMGVPSDSLVSYGTSTSATQPGRYGLNITQIATNGTVTGANTLGASTVITAGVNDSLTLTLNGTSAAITLTAGTYTQDALIAELQSKINSDSHYQSLGHKASVAHTAGVVTLTSTLYGSSSSVLVTGGTAAATLFGSTTSVTGVDVAGELGGIVGTGSGQMLTGAGYASGLQLLIEGGNTGARGTVGFSRGIAWQLDQALTSMLGTEGSLASRTEGIDRSIGDINDRRTVLSNRLIDIEKRYRKQFNALDQLVASMQQTSTYLTQQLANLPGSSSSK